MLAGAWFVVGRAVAGPLALGDVGPPVASTDNRHLLLESSSLHELGALIVSPGAAALGRLTVRSFRDMVYARRPVEQPTELWRRGVVTGVSMRDARGPRTADPRRSDRLRR